MTFSQYWTRLTALSLASMRPPSVHVEGHSMQRSICEMGCSFRQSHRVPSKHTHGVSSKEKPTFFRFFDLPTTVRNLVSDFHTG